MRDKTFGLSGFGLKLIAMITMPLDHMAVLWLSLYANSLGQVLYFDFNTGLDSLYTIMRGIGRLAFPIYAFLLVEGFFHTSSLKRCALRLFALALVSEIPFNFLVSTMFIDWYHNNVMWTLFIGLLAMALVDYCRRRASYGGFDILWRIGSVLASCGAIGIGYICHVDYRLGGVGCILLMYILFGSSRKSHLLSFAAGTAFLACTSSAIELVAFGALIPVYFYNAKRGSMGAVATRICSWYYPLHIALLDLAVLLAYIR